MKLYTRPRAFIVSQLEPGDQIAVDPALSPVLDYHQYIDLELDDKIMWSAVHVIGYSVEDGWEIIHTHGAHSYPAAPPSLIMRQFIEIDPWSYIRHQ